MRQDPSKGRRPAERSGFARILAPAEARNPGNKLSAAWNKDDDIDRLARLVVHIPNKYEQLVRYVGFYSNKSRGVRKKAGTDDIAPSIAPGETTSKQFRRNRARLVQKIREVDPLRCPNCEHRMRIVSILESGPVVEKILEHLDLWDARNHDPPPEEDSHISELVCDDSDSRIPQYDYRERIPPLEKKTNFGIGAELRPEKGRFPCLPGCFRLSANHFQSIGNLCPFPFRFDDHPGEQLKNPLYFR